MKLGIYLNCQHPASDDPVRRLGETLEQIRLIRGFQHPRRCFLKIASLCMLHSGPRLALFGTGMRSRAADKNI